jgi:hypothetical protein
MQNEDTVPQPQQTPAEPVIADDCQELFVPLQSYDEPDLYIQDSFFDHLADAWAAEPERWDGLE